MEEIRFQQINAPRPMTGKSFLLGVAAVLLRLAIAQILCNLLITATGVGLLNIAFYLYAVVTLFRFMRKTVAGSAYTLKEKSLVLQKRLGDSTTSVIEIPLDEIVSIRPICAGERLKVCYKQVTVMDSNAAVPMRIRWGWRASLLSARLARKIAGNGGMRRLAMPSFTMKKATHTAVPASFARTSRCALHWGMCWVTALTRMTGCRVRR